MWSGRGISIGSEVSGGVSNVRIEHNVLHGPSEHGIHIKTAWARGGYVVNVTYNNNSIGNIVGDAVLGILTHYGASSNAKLGPSPHLTRIQNVAFRNISRTADATTDTHGAGAFNCFGKMAPCINISFENIALDPVSSDPWQCTAITGASVTDVAPKGLSEVCRKGGLQAAGTGNGLASANQQLGQIQTMVWAGHKRLFYVMPPPDGSLPTALIVALAPANITDAMKFCLMELGDVAARTGALVVCPAAMSFNSSGPGHPGQPTPCWRSFPEYGYCLGGKAEDSEDMDFLAALIALIKAQHVVPENRTIMSGISNGGSGAFRFNCEHSDIIDGLVVAIQAWFDPWVGYFDYVHHQLPPDRQPLCSPKHKVPFYGVDGTKDWFYGQPPCFPGFEAVANWKNFSTDVLGCEGSPTVTQRGPHDFPQGSPTVCYEYPSCPAITGAGLNIMCEVTEMKHDPSALGHLLPAAFEAFFGSDS